MKEYPELYGAQFETRLGWIEATTSEHGLCSVRALDEAPAQPCSHSHPILAACATQLDEYFQGTRKTFDVPLDAGGTPFQQTVWKALRAIPYGTTATYGELARKLGMPTASRAVGAANGRNPIWVIVPCHRVVGASGALVGYAGGLSRKMQLLDLEKKHSGNSLF
ncbi:MAG TPA: methylated-DNA--[protein]-cysteine S-methyltransferase [Abditibacteriaceae bacterium]|jgi:methylated-DNA-[protein]-cysteine S-methyltransferase